MYLIRPNLKKKYRNLCNYNTPINTLLFGSDISKEIKNLDKDKFDFKPYCGRALSKGNYRRGQQSRFQPYTTTQGYSQTYGSYRGRYNPWVLETVQEYQIDFESKPYQLSIPKQINFNLIEKKVVDSEVYSLLMKGAIIVST